MLMQTNMRLVTILMSGYKSQKDLLIQALESIKSQTYKNVELVFVNDGCSGEILSVVKTYNVYFSVKIVGNGENYGLPKALNNGLKYAEGFYIARFDDDDIMLPTRIEKQVELMESNNDLAGCWSEYETINTDNIILRQSCIANTHFLEYFLMRGCCCCHSTLMVRHDVLQEVGGYNESYRYAQDLELYLKILDKHKMDCVAEHLVQFRVNTYRNPIEKQLFSFIYSYTAVVEYVWKHRTARNWCRLLVRTLLFVKFVLYDIMKQKASE